MLEEEGLERAPATAPKAARRRGVGSTLLWVGVAGAAFIGGAILFLGNGAPSAVVGAALAIIPYVFARACDEINLG